MNAIKIEYPSLETERIKLRLLTLEDANEVFTLFSDSEVTRYMDIEPCKDIREAEEIIQFHMDDSGCRWGLFKKDDNIFIGTAGFHYLRKSEHLIAEIGFDLAKDYWGNGYMLEAMKEVILFGFNEMGLDVIDATVEPANEKSLQLMRKLGFEEHEELKDHLVYFTLKKPTA